MFREPKGDFLIAGDWHGSWPQADTVIRHAKEKDIDTIFHVGDFGIWNNDKPFLNRIQALIGEWDIQMYFIDGNHEDFDRLYQKKVLEDGTRYVRDNIHHIPRGYRWEWKGLKFMGLGGAASIDKDFRRSGRSWWIEELLTDEDIAKGKEGGPVDIMFTHDSPAGAPNSITDDWHSQMGAIKYYGEHALAYCNDHRKRLQEVTDVAVPRLLFHGHYHKAMNGVFRHSDANRTVGEVFGLDQGIGRLPAHTFQFDFSWVEKRIKLLDNIQF